MWIYEWACSHFDEIPTLLLGLEGYKNRVVTLLIHILQLVLHFGSIYFTGSHVTVCISHSLICAKNPTLFAHHIIAK